MARLTVRELLDSKGNRRFTFVQVTRAEEAVAAAEAGMDMIGTGWIDGRKEIAGSVPETQFAYGLQYGHHASALEALRAAFSALAAGAHSIYSPMSPNVIEVLAREGVPIIAHVGLVPPKATWTGGMRAVGKTADQAVRIYREIKAFESAGAFAVEIEVVPHRVASEISRRTSLLTVSLGAGAGCDVQYLFSADLLGDNPGHIPRHAKTYRDFTAERARLQRERVEAYGEYIAEVTSGTFPAARHMVDIADDEYEAFLETLECGVAPSTSSHTALPGD